MIGTQNRRTALRASLLASLGLLPLACGGTSQGGNGEDGGSSSKAGSSNKAGSTHSAGTSSGGATGGPACTNPVLDAATGLTNCDEGYSHRPEASVCGAVTGVGAAPAQGGAAGIGAALPRADGSVPCAEDPTTCSAYQNGYCNNRGELAAPTCLSGCVVDQECGAGFICVCGHDESPTNGVCRPSSCLSDLECPYGFCATYSEVCGEGGFACNSPDDDCTTNAECPSGTCSYDSSLGHRACNNAVCGRPFLVEAQARLAPLVSGSAWLQAGAAPRLEHLTPAERAELAAHWSKLGQMEHASIAAFARFSLQLLSLGAPPELVEACTQALADETAHTKLCFKLASAYAGRAVGPGPLNVTGSLRANSLEEIVDLVIAEGCFGETSAALDAQLAADEASDPVIRAAYAQIASDEERHAQLAFRFVRWALQLDHSTTHARILAALNQQSPSPAVDTVVAPCLKALLATNLAA